MNVVWLKRDARLLDHEPLYLAASRDEPMVLLYVYEDCHLKSDTYHEAHHNFINEGLADVDAKVRKIADTGGGVVYPHKGSNPGLILSFCLFANPAFGPLCGQLAQR